ncbi:unnamed protein product, partial [Rotaria sordida]
MFPFGLATLQ